MVDLPRAGAVDEGGFSQVGPAIVVADEEGEPIAAHMRELFLMLQEAIANFILPMPHTAQICGRDGGAMEMLVGLGGRGVSIAHSFLLKELGTGVAQLSARLRGLAF